MRQVQAQAQADQLIAEGRKVAEIVRDYARRASAFQDTYNAALTDGNTVPGDPADQVQAVSLAIEDLACWGGYRDGLPEVSSYEPWKVNA